MSTYTNLLNSRANYINKESDGPANIRNPGRREAAISYMNDLKDFVKKATDEAQKSVANKQSLLDDRIKNKEYRNVYPLLNYDFDYKEAMKKTLNPYQLDITNEPSFGKFMDSTIRLKEYGNALLLNKFPNQNTIAGVTDTVTENKDIKKITDITRAEDEKLPYPSFRKDYPECLYPTTGEAASSYFINVGTCPTRITDKETCLKKGYQWNNDVPLPKEYSKFVGINDTSKSTNVPASDSKPPPPTPPKGNCYKPRFMYIDNRANGVFGANGAVPTLFNDLGSITPDKLNDIMSGYGVSGSGFVPCSTEEFSNINNNNTTNYISLILLVSILGLSVYVGINK